MTLTLLFEDEPAAFAACDLIDDALGYPREEMDQQGRAVITQRWTSPVALVGGGWAVQVPDGWPPELAFGQVPEERDLAALVPRDAVDA